PCRPSRSRRRLYRDGRGPAAFLASAHPEEGVGLYRGGRIHPRGWLAFLRDAAPPGQDPEDQPRPVHHHRVLALHGAGAPRGALIPALAVTPCQAERSPDRSVSVSGSGLPMPRKTKRKGSAQRKPSVT